MERVDRKVRAANCCCSRLLPFLRYERCIVRSRFAIRSIQRMPVFFLTPVRSIEPRRREPRHTSHILRQTNRCFATRLEFPLSRSSRCAPVRSTSACPAPIFNSNLSGRPLRSAKRRPAPNIQSPDRWGWNHSPSDSTYCRNSSPRPAALLVQCSSLPRVVDGLLNLRLRPGASNEKSAFKSDSAPPTQTGLQRAFFTDMRQPISRPSCQSIPTCATSSWSGSATGAAYVWRPADRPKSTREKSRPQRDADGKHDGRRRDYAAAASGPRTCPPPRKSGLSGQDFPPPERDLDWETRA